MDIGLAHGGTAIMVVYAIHLLVRVMRDPERIGAWLPRLVTSWHREWDAARKARAEPVDDDGEQPKELRAVQ
jgi:hypothetical protein